MGLMSDYAGAIPRVGGSALAGAVATPLSGLAGLAELLRSGSLNRANAAVGDVAGMADFTKDTPEDRQLLTLLSLLGKPTEMASEGLGQIGEATGIPGAEPFMATLGAASSLALPFLPKSARPGGVLSKTSFGKNGFGLGRFETTTPERILYETRNNGGYSVNLLTGERPKSGYMVGKYANDDPHNIVIDSDKVTPAVVRGHAKKNASELEKPDMYYGTWIGDDGKAYFDVSRRFDKLEDAFAFGRKTKQDAVFDVKNQEGIPIPY